MPDTPMEMLRLYYEGVRGCAAGLEFPEEWRRVLYVLLRKPRGDQRLVRKRRHKILL